MALAVGPDAARADGGAHDAPPGWTLYDGGALLSPADWTPGATPLELIIDFFAAGNPPVKWETSSAATIEFCTHQQGRPPSVTETQFRDSVARAAQLWNNVEAAIGIDYLGDCEHATTWDTENRRNEIGWDDARNIVRSPAAAVTQGSWFIHPGRREFAETDVILDHLLNVPAQCLDSTIAHEVGHALGIGHSTVLGDLMYPSFDSGNVSTCPVAVSAEEVAVLQGLYGVNRKPVLTLAPTHAAVAGARTTITAQATDPEGDTLTYTWTQTSGETVGFTPTGAAMSFTAPAAGAELGFHLVVADKYLHSVSADIVVTVGAGTGSGSPGLETKPTAAPSLEALLPTAGGRLGLTWTPSAGAAEYRFCTTPTGTVQQTCEPHGDPTALMTWPVVLGEAGASVPRRIFTTGTRQTSLEGCNDHGCSPLGAGPHLGGLRWVHHEVDYDYFAMSFDVPGTGIRFTIAGVLNLSDQPRKFTLYTGAADNYVAKRITNCGQIAAGNLCIGLLGPGDGGHSTFATIMTERTGTPVLEHRIRIR